MWKNYRHAADSGDWIKALDIIERIAALERPAVSERVYRALILASFKNNRKALSTLYAYEYLSEYFVSPKAWRFIGDLGPAFESMRWSEMLFYRLEDCDDCYERMKRKFMLTHVGGHVNSVESVDQVASELLRAVLMPGQSKHASGLLVPFSTIYGWSRAIEAILKIAVSSDVPTRAFVLEELTAAFTKDRYMRRESTRAEARYCANLLIKEWSSIELYSKCPKDPLILLKLDSFSGRGRYLSALKTYINSAGSAVSPSVLREYVKISYKAKRYDEVGGVVNEYYSSISKDAEILRYEKKAFNMLKRISQGERILFECKSITSSNLPKLAEIICDNSSLSSDEKEIIFEIFCKIRDPADCVGRCSSLSATYPRIWLTSGFHYSGAGAIADYLEAHTNAFRFPKDCLWISGARTDLIGVINASKSSEREWIETLARFISSNYLGIPFGTKRPDAVSGVVDEVSDVRARCRILNELKALFLGLAKGRDQGVRQAPIQLGPVIAAMADSLGRKPSVPILLDSVIRAWDACLIRNFSGSKMCVSFRDPRDVYITRRDEGKGKVEAGEFISDYLEKTEKFERSVVDCELTKAVQTVQFEQFVQDSKERRRLLLWVTGGQEPLSQAGPKFNPRDSMKNVGLYKQSDLRDDIVVAIEGDGRLSSYLQGQSVSEEGSTHG
ncbi:hypothetical protein J2T60_001898 [Natronospira proteinivora]|uniref:Uncharacterized protein n=1 Tax=Natronospira proteinivora TaxID=1807133 RepID=A0ABT1GC90_9GAMM|nr:hypothetical protein [Natronospira proteinivora]MCP1727898.1 hypothetical protein [Natronospira proteinivora]